MGDSEPDIDSMIEAYYVSPADERGFHTTGFATLRRGVRSCDGSAMAWQYTGGLHDPLLCVGQVALCMQSSGSRLQPPADGGDAPTSHQCLRSPFHLGPIGYGHH